MAIEHKENSKTVENRQEKSEKTYKMEEYMDLETEKSFQARLETPELSLKDETIEKYSLGYFGRFIDIDWHSYTIYKDEYGPITE